MSVGVSEFCNHTWFVCALMCRALMTKLLGPLQVKIEEWKKTTAHLEREHDKGQSITSEMF